MCNNNDVYYNIIAVYTYILHPTRLNYVFARRRVVVFKCAVDNVYFVLRLLRIVTAEQLQRNNIFLSSKDFNSFNGRNQCVYVPLYDDALFRARAIQYLSTKNPFPFVGIGMHSICLYDSILYCEIELIILSSTVDRVIRPPRRRRQPLFPFLPTITIILYLIL